MAEHLRAVEARPMDHVSESVAAMASRPTRRQWALAGGWTAFIAAVATGLAVNAGKTGLPLAGAILTLAILTLPYMAFCFTPIGGAVRDWMRRSPVAPAAVLLAAMFIYTLYALLTGAFDLLALVRVQAFVATPLVLVLAARERPTVTWLDFAAIAAIWLPFNFGQINAIWTWPEGEAAYILNTPLAVNLAICLFLGLRGFPECDVRFNIKARSLPLVGACLALFMLIAVPLGLGTHFLTWNPRLTPDKLLGQPLAIFFFIALPEELLFRGLLQGLLARRTGRPILALVVASLLFGASHYHTYPAPPDLRYLGLAAVAGIFYGYTYKRTGSVATCALLHAAVDSLWELFFHM